MSRHRDSPHPRNLYIASLPSTFTSEQLGELFKPFGTILSVRMKPKAAGSDAHLIGRCGFVLFQEAGEATRALAAMGGQFVGGMQIEVRRAWMTPQLNPAARNVAAFHVPKAAEATTTTTAPSGARASITEIVSDPRQSCELASFETPVPSWTSSGNSLTASETTTRPASSSSSVTPPSVVQSPSTAVPSLPSAAAARSVTARCVPLVPPLSEGNPLSPSIVISPSQRSTARKSPPAAAEPPKTIAFSPPAMLPPPAAPTTIFALAGPAFAPGAHPNGSTMAPLMILTSVPKAVPVAMPQPQPQGVYCYPAPMMSSPFAPQPFAVAPQPFLSSVVPMMPAGAGTHAMLPQAVALAPQPAFASAWPPRYII